MTYRETIYLNEKDIKTIIAKTFNTEEYNVDILVDNDQFKRDVQIRVERRGETTAKELI